MSTQDVPGANVANKDELAAGCWAEHEDGSLLFVKGTENGQVVYELYDVSADPVMNYQDAMRESAFKTKFSFPPIGMSAEKWTWHDKTPFPWDRVMKFMSSPAPRHSDVHDQLSAAARVAESLRLKGKELKEDAVEHMTERTAKRGVAIMERLQRALDAFMGEETNV